jgi:hypothetical protein
MAGVQRWFTHTDDALQSLDTQRSGERLSLPLDNVKKKPLNLLQFLHLPLNTAMRLLVMMVSWARAWALLKLRRRARVESMQLQRTLEQNPAGKYGAKKPVYRTSRVHVATHLLSQQQVVDSLLRIWDAAARHTRDLRTPAESVIWWMHWLIHKLSYSFVLTTS